MVRETMANAIEDRVGEGGLVDESPRSGGCGAGMSWTGRGPGALAAAQAASTGMARAWLRPSAMDFGSSDAQRQIVAMVDSLAA